MKYLSILIFLLLSQPFYSQNKFLSFAKTKMYLGEIDITKVISVEFEFENISDKDIILSYEPITNLVNASYPKTPILPNQKGKVTVNFYPEAEGIFDEKLYIKANGKDNVELEVYGKVSSMSRAYKSMKNDDKLFGDRDITFMVVDGKTLRGIPFSKIFIRNIENNKSYIGTSDHYGILVNRIPEGHYHIKGLIDGYKDEILDVRLDPNRNVAMVLMEKKEEQKPMEKPIVKIDTQEMEVEESLAIEPEKPVKKMEADGTRKALNIILLIDVSKSMEKPNRIGVLKKSIIHLVNNYETNDQLSILTFNDHVNTLLERKKNLDKTEATNIINSILPSGTTDGVLGIDRAFEILQENYLPDAINMVILATDGKMSNSSYEDKKIFEKIEQMNERGILTSVVGFGTTNYEQQKLNKIANIGGGIFVNLNVDLQNQESVLLDEIYSVLLKIKR